MKKLIGIILGLAFIVVFLAGVAALAERVTGNWLVSVVAAFAVLGLWIALIRRKS